MSELGLDHDNRHEVLYLLRNGFVIPDGVGGPASVSHVGAAMCGEEPFK